MAGLSKILDLFKDESGATAIEYALILGLMTLAIVGAIGDFGQAVSNLWGYVSGGTVRMVRTCR